MPNIGIVWDFDGTLSPDDSTNVTVDVLAGPRDFWAIIKKLRGDTDRPKWEHILASDAPIWMYSLSRLAATRRVPLNAEFFKEFVLPRIRLYDGVIPFLHELKALGDTTEFRELDLKVHHFVVTAGLKDLVQQAFPPGLISWTFGCRYNVVAHPDHKDEPESVPVFCMDETMKTRSLFEISKGSFNDPTRSVNSRVGSDDYWAPFTNLIYIGDGDTDVPALSLVRSHGGVAIAVYNPNKTIEEVNKRLKGIRAHRRADFITQADFSSRGQLFGYLFGRCIQIRQRYEAEREASSVWA